MNEFEADHRLFIAVAEACWRPVDPSYSWHVLDWMAFKLRRKYPLVMKRDQIVTMCVNS